MDIINLGMVNTNYSSVEIPQMKQFRMLCQINNNKITNFYGKYSRYFGGSHFLKTLTLRLYSYFKETPALTYNNLKGSDLEIAYSFWLGGISGNQRPRSFFLGEDYILAAQEFTSVTEERVIPLFNDINGRLENYTTIKPVGILYSERTSFQPISPDISKEEAGKTVVVVDFPLLAAALHQWYIDNKVDNDTLVKEEQFIGDMFYARTYLDFINHAMFNRMVLTSFNLNGDANNDMLTTLGFAQTPLGELFDKIVDSLFKQLRRKYSVSVVELLANLPMVTERDMRSLIFEYKDYYSVTLQWGMALNQKDLINKANNIALGLGVEVSDAYVDTALKLKLSPNKAKWYYGSLYKDNQPWLQEILTN